MIDSRVEIARIAREQAAVIIKEVVSKILMIKYHNHRKLRWSPTAQSPSLERRGRRQISIMLKVHQHHKWMISKHSVRASLPRSLRWIHRKHRPSQRLSERKLRIVQWKGWSHKALTWIKLRGMVTSRAMAKALSNHNCQLCKISQIMHLQFRVANPLIFSRSHKWLMINCSKMRSSYSSKRTTNTNQIWTEVMTMDSIANRWVHHSRRRHLLFWKTFNNSRRRSLSWMKILLMTTMTPQIRLNLAKISRLLKWSIRLPEFMAKKSRSIPTLFNLIIQ